MEATQPLPISKGGGAECMAGVGGAEELAPPDFNEQLLRASADGDLNKIRDLVEVRGVDPLSCRDGQFDVTPLHLASWYGHIDIVRYLVDERNCDVVCGNKYENTPLHHAALGGRLDIVQYLIIERGCDPMCRGQYGATPLHFACGNGKFDVVKYLMEVVKVDSSCQDEDTGATPLHLAVQFGTLDVVQYMIEEQQCDAQCRNTYENTPLHFAAALRGRLGIVQYLMNERGCDPLHRNKYGRTPLHYACENGRLDVVKYLMDAVKVDYSHRDETPLHIAAHCGQLPIVKLLVEDCLCDPSVRDKNGETPADIAQRENHIHITSYLSSIEKIVSTDLRRSLVAQLKPYTRKATPTGEIIGSGTYGSVIELISAKEKVAGKVFRLSSTALMQAITNKVCGELIMMTQLHHPNIVQCKGVSLLTDQPLPVLLMEWLMSNLHAYLLHPDNSNLSVERKVSILCDIASGLDYLHDRTPAIIHRDLTAKNVLLDSQLKAKIADFGNSRIMDLDPEASPEALTSLPGTLEYMPPEAQGGFVAYGPSLDVFSFGHLSLFTVTQKIIHPLPSTYHDHSTDKACARSEVKRREKCMKEAEQLLSENHSLVVMIKQCLHIDPAQRPHTRELLTRLREIVTLVYAGSEDSLSSTPAEKDSPRNDVGTDTETFDGHAEKCRDFKPDMINLRRLLTHHRVINIIEETASYYRAIGVFLLHDKYDVIVDGIEESARGKPQEAVRMIYARWMREDVEFSWNKLTQCFRDCGLNSLASDIEQHLRLQQIGGESREHVLPSSATADPAENESRFRRRLRSVNQKVVVEEEGEHREKFQVETSYEGTNRTGLLTFTLTCFVVVIVLCVCVLSLLMHMY